MDDFQVFFDTGSGFQNALLDNNKQIIIFFSHFHHDHLQGLAFNKYLIKAEKKICICSALVNAGKLKKIILDQLTFQNLINQLMTDVKKATGLN